MKKINDFSEVSPLVLKYFKRGVETNNFLTPADYKAEIAEGRLYFKEADGNLYLYLKREGFWQIFFYILNPESTVPEISERLIVEMGERQCTIAEANGFSAVMKRTQLKLTAPETAMPEGVERADCAEAVYELLKGAFNQYTGNLPSLTQIAAECREGLIFSVKADGKIVGALRSESTKASAKIKHLAVCPEFRGKGFAGMLTKAFLAENAGKKCSVWTGTDNEPAKKLYKSHGFTEDENKTTVYVKG